MPLDTHVARRQPARVPLAVSRHNLTRSRHLWAGVLIALLAFATNAFAQDQSKDYKDIDLKQHGIPPFDVKKDEKTGFIVGGTNSTSLIRQLSHINGLSITRLEAIMRPGKSSKAGFLGPKESLLDIMAADNEYVVGELGLTHQELARHLHAMGVIVALVRKDLLPKDRGAPVEFTYHGRRFRAQRQDTRGFQDSPFEDGTKSGSNVDVKNLDSGKEIRYGLLVPFMVDRYGFYEGKGTSYRVEPRQVVEVFDFLKDKIKKK